jgi:hypothetical protein
MSGNIIRQTKVSRTPSFLMHRYRDIQMSIFYPWDWVYFQVLPSWVRAETYQKQVQTQFFIPFNKGIPVLRKFYFQNMKKIPFEECHVQDPIPALPGIESEITAVFLGDT